LLLSKATPRGKSSGFSAIAASHASGAMPLGSRAVLGPVRMDYERVISLVAYTARALSRALEHQPRNSQNVRTRKWQCCRAHSQSSE